MSQKSISDRSFGSHNIAISCCFTTWCKSLIYYLVPSPIPLPTLSLLHTKEKKTYSVSKTFVWHPSLEQERIDPYWWTNVSTLVQRENDSVRGVLHGPATFGFWSCLQFNCSRFAALKAAFKRFILVQTQDEIWIYRDHVARWIYPFLFIHFLAIYNY